MRSAPAWVAQTCSSTASHSPSHTSQTSTTGSTGRIFDRLPIVLVLDDAITHQHGGQVIERQSADLQVGVALTITVLVLDRLTSAQVATRLIRLSTADNTGP